MDSSRAIAGYRVLLRLYPRQFREHFAEAMEQTFRDLYRERTHRPALFLLWIFAETFAGVLRERATTLVRYAMTDFLNVVKHAAITLAGLMIAGIVTLMILARGTGEDIAGIVALGLFVTILSLVAAITAAFLRNRRRRNNLQG